MGLPRRAIPQSRGLRTPLTDDARHLRLILEVHHEAGKVDLRLMARRRLEAQLVGLRALVGADGCHEPLHGGVGTIIAALAQLPCEADGAELWKGCDALAQIVEVGGELIGPSDLTRSVDRQLEPACDILADGLWISPGASGDGGNGQTLTVDLARCVGRWR